MLNIVKEQKGNVLIVRLTGSIEESVHFDQLIGPPPAEIHVYCKDVPRINSVGVKAWLKYFLGAKNAKGTKLKLLECSTAIVEQLNLISNFSAGGTVESFYVPFSCEKCHAELVGLFKSDDIRRTKLKIPDLKCTKCGSRAVFDDLPEDYLGFLLR